MVAPDFFGFGRSDKPVDDTVYTFDFHRNSLIAFLDHLDLNNITLVCQDWGGLLGLTLPLNIPERFSRMLIMNTTLGTGDVQHRIYPTIQDHVADRSAVLGAATLVFDT